MTKAQALKKARSIWGKNALVEYSRKAPNAKKKAELKEADPARWKKVCHWDKCKVGHFVSFFGIGFFHVRGSGDTWDEAFAHAASKPESTAFPNK